MRERIEFMSFILIEKLPESLLGFGRKILEQLGHGLVELLLCFFRVAVGIHGISNAALPNQLFGAGIIEINDDGADIDGRACGRAHAATPARAHAGAVPVPLALFLQSNLIRDGEIRGLTFDLGEALSGELLVDRLLDLRVDDMVRVNPTRHSAPPVSLELGEIGAGHGTRADPLARSGRNRSEKSEHNKGKEPSL